MRSVHRKRFSEKPLTMGEHSVSQEYSDDFTLSNEVFLSRDLPESKVLIQINSHILRVFDQLQEKKWDLENKLKYQTMKANVYKKKFQVGAQTNRRKRRGKWSFSSAPRVATGSFRASARGELICRWRRCCTRFVRNCSWKM